jgi:hypothetical protein
MHNAYIIDFKRFFQINRLKSPDLLPILVATQSPADKKINHEL